MTMGIEIGKRPSFPLLCLIVREPRRVVSKKLAIRNIVQMAGKTSLAA
jgi:hypothetical protein